MGIYEWCASVTLLSAFVSAGFSIQDLLTAQRRQDDVITAQYALARSGALAVIAIGLFIFKSNAFVIALAAIMIVVQLSDSLIGEKVSRFKSTGAMWIGLTNAFFLLVLLAA